MTGTHGELPTVWQEVRQRRVGKVVIAYLALTFGGIEAAMALFPLLSPPEWLWRVALGTLVLGFPVATVFAWTFDITPKGLVRTPDHLGEPPDDPMSYVWLVLTVIGLAAGVGLHLLRG